MTDATKEHDSNIESVKSILKSHGITMSVWGCGCCGSPHVRVVYNGKKIIDDRDSEFSMFEDDAND